MWGTSGQVGNENFETNVGKAVGWRMVVRASPLFNGCGAKKELRSVEKAEELGNDLIGVCLDDLFEIITVALFVM